MLYCDNETCEYSLFCEKLVSEEGTEYDAYGIIVRGENRETLIIPDVSTDREALERLVGLCNSEKLNVIHIYDVIEDFLST